MSQTPWPYPQQPQPYPPVTYYAPGPDPYRAILAPARRAAIFVIVVSALMALCGVILGALGLIAPPELIDQALQGAQNPEISPQIMRFGFGVLGCGGMLLGFALLLTGIFIWRGSGAAIIIAIILTSLCLLLSLISSISNLPKFSGTRSGAEMAGLGCSVIVVPLLLVLMFAFLIQALKSVRLYRQSMEQYQMQYWQYQQAQQMYQQPTYGPPQLQQQPPPPLAGGPDGTSNQI